MHGTSHGAILAEIISECPRRMYARVCACVHKFMGRRGWGALEHAKPDVDMPNTNQNKACKHKSDLENEENRENGPVPSVKRMRGWFRAHARLQHTAPAFFGPSLSAICLCPFAVGLEGAAVGVA